MQKHSKQTDKPKIVQKTCKTHGLTDYSLEGSGYYRCKQCRCDYVKKRRRNVKKQLIEDFGGKCRLCGYNRWPAALQFHHLDPNKKDFEISDGGATKAYSTLCEEAKKCVLICANCHAAIHAGNDLLLISAGKLSMGGTGKAELVLPDDMAG